VEGAGGEGRFCLVKYLGIFFFRVEEWRNVTERTLLNPAV
jgi:hypothetical protein